MFCKKKVLFIYHLLGIVRRFYNLGDRISCKRFQSNTGKVSTVVRFIAVEIDANPKTLKLVEDIAKANSESLMVYTHKLKDMDYFKTVTNLDKWKNYSKEDSALPTEKEMYEKMGEIPSIQEDLQIKEGENIKLDSNDQIKKMFKL